MSIKDQLNGPTANKIEQDIRNMATKAKENERMRNERIAGSDNGRTLRTRVIKDKKKYSRKKKHKKDEE